MVIYITTNLINGKRYIGSDTKNKSKYLGSGTLLKLAIKKYGKENFRKDILEVCDTISNMKKREEYWLNYYDAGNNRMFYNMHNYSNGSGIPSMETRNKMCESHRRRDNTGEKNPMYGRTGKNHPLFGKKHLEETRKKIGDSVRGKCAGKNNGRFKSEVYCISGIYRGDRLLAKEWCNKLSVDASDFYSHLRGTKYKKGIKGNFFKWEK